MSVKYERQVGDNYYIVAMPDVYSVIINAGSNESVEKGDHFDIVGNGLEIVDPKTGKSLGFLGGAKGTVFVKDVYDKMCLCQNIETDNNFAPVSTAMMMGLISKLVIAEPMSLDVDENQVGLEGAIDEAPIKIGDKVIHLKRIVENDDDNSTPKDPLLLEN